MSLPPANAQTKLSQLSNWSLLLTKLWCPVLPGQLIERDSLIERRLNSGSHWCICGSAGYGKTTLAALYCNTHGRNYGWLSLDIDDNNPERFSLYLAAAFIFACPDRIRFREMVEAQKSLHLNQIITSLLNEALLAEQPIVLVLDDYHLIANPDIHSGVSMLLNRASENFKIIIVSRSRPNLGLSHLQMQGRVDFTGVEDLAFNHEKSLAYLQSFCPNIDSGKVESLVRANEGWPAGLRGLALFFASADSSLAISESNLINSTAISDYFWEQVLGALPERLQIFLLYTSILDTFDAELCTAVIGWEDATLLLAEALQRQLFITSLGTDKQWFRYHNLFHVFLTKQLQARHSDIIEHLHRCASEAWLMRGYIANALKHALAIADVTHVSNALLHTQQSLMAQGHGALLERAILLLNDEYICQHPPIVMLACSYWLNRNQEKVLQLISTAGLILEAPSDQSASHLQALFKLYRAKVAVIRDQIEEIIHWSDRALLDLLATDLASRSQAYVLLAEGHTRMGNIDLAISNWQKGERLAQQASNPSLVAWSRHQLAMIALGQGAFAEAQLQQDQAINFATANCFSGDSNLWCLHRARAETAWEYFDLEGVELHCNKAAQVCQHWLQSGEVPIAIIRARSELSLGQQNQASNYLQCALEIFKTTHTSSYVKSFVYLTQAEFYLRAGAKSSLMELLHKLVTPTDYINDIAQRIGRAKAICHFGIGDSDSAIDILNKMNKEAKQFSLVTEEWRNNIWLAACYCTKGCEQRAIASLQQCLAFAAERGLLGSLLITAPYLEPLFEVKVADNEIQIRHWRRLRDLLIHSRAHAHRNQQVPRTISALAITAKEWRVLELTLTGAGNEEIALRLNLSLGTVKNTLTRIYRKLDVRDRDAACRLLQQVL